MNVDNFSKQVVSMHNRLSRLFEQASDSSFVPLKYESSALKELGIAMEELQVALEEMQQQNEILSETVETAAAERKRYQKLFHFSPEAYLVTSLDGEILEANRMAAELLGTPADFLVGELLIAYLSESDRASFEPELTKRQQRDSYQEWELRFEPRYHKPFDAACIVVADRAADGTPETLRWAIRDISERKRIANLEKNGNDNSIRNFSPLENRSLEWFNRGELIPLYPQSVWYINQGLVKLTNLTEQNKEVLLGILGPGLPFGAYLTSLPLYEAVAITDVQAVAISVSEIMANCQLSQLLFAKTCQRLRQTEALLAISGERQLEDRLYRLLCLLKDDVGQPSEQGTCLSIRLTPGRFSECLLYDQSDD